jgi:pyrimidine-specific ribonucleoside hydrolase
MTYPTAVDRAGIERLRSGGPVGAPAARMLDHYLGYYGAALSRDAVVVHDAVAIAAAVRPELIHTTSSAVIVDCSEGEGRGRTIIDPEAVKRPVEVGTALEAAAIIDMIIERIASYRAPA